MRRSRIRSHPVGMPVWAVWAGRHVLPIARPFHPGVDRFAGNLSLECTGRSEGHIDRRRTGPDHLLRSSISRELLDRGGSIHRKRRPLRAADALATCFPPTRRDRPASYFACKRSSPVCNLTLSGSATTSPNGPPSFSPEAHHGGCHPRTGNILHAACYHPPLRKADAGADDTVRLPSSLPFLRDDRDGRLPNAARAALLEMADQIDKLTDKVELLDAKIIAGVKADDAARRLTTIPGVGPIIAATVGSPFRIRRRSEPGGIWPPGSASPPERAPAEARNGSARSQSAAISNCELC